MAHSYRKANQSDIQHILMLVGQNLDTLLPRTQEQYHELLDTTWVAEDSGDILGTCTLEIYSPKIAEIRSLVVAAAHRHKGIGRDLVEIAVAEAKKRQVHEILVVTSSKEYFERLNFGACLNEKYALFWSGR